MYRTVFHKTEVEAVHGNIAEQDGIRAVVNAANAELRIGGGVAGALHRTAGPELEQACRPLAPIRPGEAVLTSAFQLPNQYVIHCLGPVYGRDKPESELLADCYRNALNLAEENSIDALAFPAISTGAFGYPIDEATDIALNTCNEEALNLARVSKIRFVLYSPDDLDLYIQKLKTFSS
ncbi:MAG: macro domain-containing protein [Balneolaceae bacterium]